MDVKCEECLNKYSLKQNVFVLDPVLGFRDGPVSKNKSPLDGASLNCFYLDS